MDNRILKQLYEQFGTELYLYLYSLCHNHSLAEDLRQETFLKALLALPDYHTNMRAWLYLVARNLYFNRRNKDKRLISLEGVSHEIMHLDGADDILNRFIAKRQIRMLYHSLSILPLQKREILMMQYFGDMTQREIAAILHLTPENVRVLSYRAKKELKKYMEANGYDLS
ncbi:MAG: RNA polymerase sigma factor [Mobilitalea sp.]